jgi:hypothetical protein
LTWSLALLVGLSTVAHAEEPRNVDGEIAQGWQTYRSDNDGFSVAVPDNWLANAETRLDGADIVSLSAPDSTRGLMVVVQSSADASSADDLPNTRCQPITVGGQPATRCIDTLSLSSSIAVQVGERHYQILASERRLGTELYQAILASFSFDQAAVSPPTAPPQPSGSQPIAPTSPAHYDCASSTGVSKAKLLCAVP